MLGTKVIRVDEATAERLRRAQYILNMQRGYAWASMADAARIVIVVHNLSQFLTLR